MSAGDSEAAEVEPFDDPFDERPAELEEYADDSDAALDEESEPREPSSALGILALVLAVLVAATAVIAIVSATTDEFERATQFAWIAIGGSFASFLLGAVAIVLGRGRTWAVAAVLLSIVANPVALRNILMFFSGTVTA